jgi:excinuclease ABC subunit C
LISSESYELNASDAEDNEIMESFIKEYYSRRIFSPPEILVSTKLGDTSTIQEWMQEKFGSKTTILRRVRGQKHRLLTMAVENAKSHLEELVGKRQRALRSLQELQGALHLPDLPELIECFDVSTLTGRSSVGSMVAFRHGEPLKSRYRRYKIRTVVGQDDPRMIGELIQRRYQRLLTEKSALPDLVIVDGGSTQLTSAERSLRKLGLELPVIGLAKKYEQIYVPERTEPIELQKNSEELYLIQRIRDEAHRFAISYHRKLRSKAQTSL